MAHIPTHPRRRTVLTAMAGAALPWRGIFAQTQTPIRLLVGYSPGGPVDQTGRLLASGLAEVLNTTVVVENKPGAGGLLAAQEITRAKPDGAMLYYASSPSITISTHVLKSVAVDTLNGITAIAPVLQYRNLLIVNKDRPWNTIQELVAWAKEHPGGFTFGSAGMGASNHLAAELLALRCGVQFTHVPYKGSAPALADVIGGQIDGMFDTIGQAKPQMEAGTVRALAVASLHRYPLLPDVPTMAEVGIDGLQDFDVNGWFSVYAPKGVPTAFVQRLNAAVNQTLDMPDIRQRLEQWGYEPWKGSAQTLQTRAVREHALWASVIKTIKFE